MLVRRSTKRPIPPMRRTYVVKPFISFGVDPAEHSAATRKCENVRPFVVDYGEFHNAIERHGIDKLLLHGDIITRHNVSGRFGSIHY
jgi:hypothetical protein